MKSSTVKDMFMLGATGIIQATHENDQETKEKIIANAVVTGLEYLAKKSSNQVDDVLLHMVKGAIPFLD